MSSLEISCSSLISGDTTSIKDEKYIISLKTSFEKLSEKEKSEVTNSVIINTILPILKQLARDEASFDNQLLLISSTSEYVTTLLPYASIDHIKQIFDKIFELLNGTPTNEQCKDDSPVDIHTLNDTSKNLSIALLHALFSDHNLNHTLQQFILTKLLVSLRYSNTIHSYHISSLVLPSLISGDHIGVLADQIWRFITSVWYNETTIEIRPLDLILTLLCCLVHIFIRSDLPLVQTSSSLVLNIQSSPDPVYDVCISRIFWDIVQSGLIDSDPFARKRCMFLLDQILQSVKIRSKKKGFVLHDEDYVFWWGSVDDKEWVEWAETEAERVWYDIILLLETLEEKQVHIVRPVLSRLNSLILATKTNINGHSLVHVSWLMVVMERIIVHDTKSIVKRGIIEFLLMNIKESPFLMEKNWKLFVNPLLKGFSFSFLFAREDHCNTTSVCPIVVNHFINFLQHFISELKGNEKSSFLSYFLSSCYSKKLPDIPMVYISYAISCIQPDMTTPLIKSEALSAVRSLVMSCLLTHKNTHRAATQCFLLSAVCKLGDPILDFSEIFQTLGCFRETECLLYGTSSWTEARHWITTCAAAHSTSNSLYSFLENCICSLIKGSISQSQTCTSDDQLRLSPICVAKAILLSADAHMTDGKSLPSSSSQTINEVLTSLLGPLMEAIVGAHTRVYISQERVVVAVECITSLLDQLLLGYLKTHCDVTEGVGPLLYKCMLPWLPDVLSYYQDVLLSGLHLSGQPHQPLLDTVILYKKALTAVYHFLLIHGYSGWLEGSGWSLGAAGLSQRAAEKLLALTADKVVPLSGTFLGSVSVLEWVCGSLEGWNQFEDGNNQSLPRKMNDLLTTKEHKQLLKILSQLPVNLELIKPVQPDSQTGIIATMAPLEYGPAISYGLSSYWTCLKYVLVSKSCDLHVTTTSISCDSHLTYLIGFSDSETIATACTDQFDISGKDLATPLCCLATIVPQLISIKGISYLLPIIERVWSLVLELKDHLKPFLRSLTAYLQLIYHPVLISNEDAPVIDLQMKLAQQIFAVAEVKNGVCNLLVQYLCNLFYKQYLSDPVATVTSMKARLDIFVQACTFGPVFKKNLRVIHDVDQFIESLGNKCSSNNIILSDIESDLLVRAHILTFLCELAISQNSQIFLDSFLSTFIDNIVEQLQHLKITRPRYYINSYPHRYRLRLVQTLLVLHKWINESMTTKVVMVILDCLECDNQLSVRYIMEWLVVLLIQRIPTSWEQLLLPQLQTNTGRRLSRFCSVFTVAMQLGKCLPLNDKMSYYSQVLPLVFQWSLCHHFVVRVYAAGTVLEMWRECKNLAFDSQQHSTLSSLGQYIPFIESYSDVAKSKKIESNIFFKLFHPLEDLNLQVIFNILPALTSVIEEEWIPAVTFQSCSKLWSQLSSPLPLYCTNKTILEAFYKVLRQSQDGEENGDNNIFQFDPAHQAHVTIEDDNISGDDVQKKITPWTNTTALLKQLFPMSPLLPAQLPNEETNSSFASGNLILVASLIHKAPNLGGLCRTSEIFGISELVLASSTVLDEKEFKSLSVTSEKWLKITQVKPLHLKDYLILMRKQGYSLVGIEQTANSKPVTEYSFPLKTLLLLGNEREGIPVELIHLLDDCVEIPQFGVVRSLNVHVSGALVMWEYTKQHLIH